MIWGKVISFTNRGAAVGQRIAALMPENQVELYARGIDPSIKHTFLTRMVQQAMVDCNFIIFIGAAGIAVRAVAPYLQGKTYDPAVLVVDENAQFVISLLSGHIGGANALAQRLADGLGAQAVITTATDGRGIFAVDTWAKKQGCTVMEAEQIRFLSAALLRGETIGIRSDFLVEGILPSGVKLDGTPESGFVISLHTNAQPFAHTLHLVPRIVHMGIGCRRGISQQAVEAAACMALKTHGIAWQAVCKVVSLDMKKDEAGLCAFCMQHSLPFETFSADALKSLPGEFHSSAFVRQTVGVDNVSERAAVKSAGGALVCHRIVKDGVTVALAQENWRVQF